MLIITILILILFLLPKDTKLSCCNFISRTQSKIIKNLLEKDLKDQFIGMNIKRKVRIKQYDK